MTVNRIQIFQHSKAQYEKFLALLEPHLPHGLALYRRVQFYFQTQYAVLLATFPPGTTALPDTFTVSYIDRSRRPETEAWIFTSIELLSQPVSRDHVELATQQVLAIITAASSLTLPPNSDDKTDQSPAKNATPPTDEDTKMIYGANHERLVTIFENTQILHELDFPNVWTKHLFDLNGPSRKAGATVTTLNKEMALPKELSWGVVREQDLALVRSRTSIPRQDRSLRLWPSVALFPCPQASSGKIPDDVQPIAWVFLGTDSSLSSLHVEPEYRGRGLAKLVAAKLFGTYLMLDESKSNDGAKQLGSSIAQPFGMRDGNRWAHADINSDNKASTGVALSLGAEPGWDISWCRVDLCKVEQEMEKRRLSVETILAVDV